MARFSLTVLLLLYGTAVLCAESKISFRQLTRTFPVAVQRGTTREIEVSSNFTLNESHSAFFAPAGPDMEFAEPKKKPDEWADPEESDIGTPFRFRVRVPDDQRPGDHDDAWPERSKDGDEER